MSVEWNNEVTVVAGAAAGIGLSYDRSSDALNSGEFQVCHERKNDQDQ